LTIKGYDFTPTRLVLPGIPILPNAPLNVGQVPSEGTILMAGVRTDPTTLHSARREAEEMLANCRGRVAHREYHALIELLDANPAFIADAWVRETYLDLAKKKLLVRRRGRIEGQRRIHPLVVAGLVTHLIDRGEVAGPEKAFGRLEELGLLRYETAKDLYYRGRREDRFQAILLERPELTRRVSTEAGNALLGQIRVLQAGETLTYRGYDPVRGETELTFHRD